jgi:hypothetical protein
MPSIAHCIRASAGIMLVVSSALVFSGEPAAETPPVSQQPRRPQPSSPIALIRSGWQDAVARINQVEGVQQAVTTVRVGVRMGPGDGWFHPSRSRYGWPWLAQHFDQDGNEIVTVDEFAGAAELFRRLDRDGNGELKSDDFDWSDASPFVRQQSQAGQWFSRVDKSSNGRITADEWQQFFERVAGEKGFISREDLRSGLFPAAPARSAQPSTPGQEEPSRLLLLMGLLSGELGSLCEGPGIDQPAPDFELETQDHQQTIRLSTFQKGKPVVLIFGSFT